MRGGSNCVYSFAGLAIAVFALMLSCDVQGDLPDSDSDLEDEEGVSEFTRHVVDSWGNLGIAGGTLRARGATPDHFRAWNTVTRPVSEVTAYLYSGLVRRNPATMQFDPLLAESVEYASDHSSVDVTLRRGLRWSDGEVLDVEDVLFSVSEIYQNDSVESSPSLKVNEHLATFTATGPRSFSVSAPTPYAGWGELLSFPILPKHVLEPILDQGASELNDIWAYDNTSLDEIVGSGPFLPSESDGVGDRLLLEANPYYFEEDAGATPLPYLEAIELVPGSKVDLMNAGDIDIGEIGGMDRSNIGDPSGFAILNMGTQPGSEFLAMNQNPDAVNENTDVQEHIIEWLQITEFRQALAHLVNRQFYVDDIYDGFATPRYSPIAPDSPFYWDGSEEAALKYDTDAAEELLDGLGWTEMNEDGIRLDDEDRPLKLRLMTNDNSSTRIQIAESIKQKAESVGIELNFTKVSFDDGADSLVGRLIDTYDWELIVIGLTSSIDPISSANSFPSSGSLHMIAPERDEPLFDWQEDVDDAFEAAARTTNMAERKNHYQILQEIWLEEVPWVYTVSEDSYVAYADDLQNIGADYVHPFTGYAWRSLVSRLYFE